MIGHHGASIFCCLLSLMTNVSGSEVVGCLFGAEVSNPFLQARWFMLEAGLRETRACRIIEVTFALVFLSCRSVPSSPHVALSSESSRRVFWAPTLLWVVVASPKPPQTIKVGAVLLQIIRCRPLAAVTRPALTLPSAGHGPSSSPKNSSPLSNVSCPFDYWQVPRLLVDSPGRSAAKRQSRIKNAEDGMKSSILSLWQLPHSGTDRTVRQAFY